MFLFITFAAAKVLLFSHICKKKRPKGAFFLMNQYLFGMPPAVIEGFDKIDSGR